MRGERGDKRMGMDRIGAVAYRRSAGHIKTTYQQNRIHLCMGDFGDAVGAEFNGKLKGERTE